MTKPKPDAIYRWHRLALQGADSLAPRTTLAQALAALDPDEIPAFTQFLVWHKLGALWHQNLETADLLGSINRESARILRTNRIETTALYLAQRQALAEIDQLFEQNSIPYVAVKGTSIREIVYPDAALRPASDIDILVASERRLEAARVLIEAGYEFDPNPENIDWEATFSRGPISIDLHWNILRSGRTRHDTVPGLLERRKRRDFHWSLSVPDSMTMMLVHPAFTKYVTSSNMSLISVVDMLLFLGSQRVDWDTVANRLEEMGLRTAAWTVSTWFRIISPVGSLAKTDSVYARLQPGPARRAYLGFWVKNDLASHWLNHPLPIQVGFTLALHDQLSDAATAIAGWLQTRSARHRDPLLRLGRDQNALDLA